MKGDGLLQGTPEKGAAAAFFADLRRLWPGVFLALLCSLKLVLALAAVFLVVLGILAAEC